MSGYVLFQMWAPLRQSLIADHLFYVEQAHKRLLSQFEDIEAEANKAGENWIEQNSCHFDPDRHNSGDFHQAADNARDERYLLLSEMRDRTRLSVVAGMFHEWDKRLRDWLVREIQHWHYGNEMESKVWSADFPQISELLECLGWPICSATYFQNLDACRLVVNVYKHGKGKSLEDLKRKYPEYLHDPFGGCGNGCSDVKYRDHTHLKVSDEQFQAFSDAIVAFWQEVPENIFQSKVKGVPGWFGKALLKDNTDQ